MVGDNKKNSKTPTLPNIRAVGRHTTKATGTLNYNPPDGFLKKSPKFLNGRRM
jgi:hypothetical protein